MTLIDNTHYLPLEDYDKPIEDLRRFTGIVLLLYADHSQDLKDRIIRNFIARGMACLKSILGTWTLGNIQDCWILHRSLIDRLLHLRSIRERNEFEVFEKWSFLRKFENKNSLVSDPEIRHKLNPEWSSFSSTDRNRHDQLKREKIQWKRPSAKQVFKDMHLSLLYKVGYDFASSHVHPMANDGEEDFLKLTGLASEPLFDKRVALHNSLVIQLTLIQEGLIASNPHWRGLVSEILDQYFSLLETGSREYLVTLEKLFNAGPDFQLCQQPENV